MTITDTTPVVTPALFLRLARESAGLKQAELAERLGVRVLTVQRAEADKAPLRQERIVAWAVACGVNPVWLQWNIDACGQPDMPFDLTPGQYRYTPRDSNPEPADSVLRGWVLAA